MQIDLMNKVAATGSRTEKEALLQNANVSTQAFLRYALDPFTTFGVTLDPETVLHAVRPSANPTAWWSGLRVILDQLAQRSLTGHAATEALTRHFVAAPSRDHAEWGLRVLHQDLRCGVSTKTLMKVFPGLIQPFEVALAQAYDPDKHDLQGVGYIEPKLDGLRVTVVDGIGYTRNGNRIQGADVMLDELGSILRGVKLRDCVFDGEFIGSGTFEETVSKARSTGQDDRGLVYNIFDLVRRGEWDARKTRPFSARRQDVDRLISPNGKYVKCVPSVKLTNPTTADVFAARDRFMAQGFEGAMWKDGEASYEFKRSDAILKIKKFDTGDAPIVGFEEGKGKYVGMLGKLIVQLPNGRQAGIGGGYTNKEREDFWRDREKLVGKTLEYQYQNMTAKGSLRFPVYVRIRSDR